MFPRKAQKRAAFRQQAALRRKEVRDPQGMAARAPREEDPGHAAGIRVPIWPGLYMVL